MTWLDKIIGPRIPDSVLHRERRRFRRPTLLLGTAALLLLISIFFPYWRIRLYAPQYPGGLVAKVYVNRVEGDVREIDGLNHYIGMRPLEEAAQLERSLSIILIVAMALLVAGAIYVHSPWAAVLSLPALLYPLIFLADLYYWLWNFGTHLDPRAPLSSSVKPFVPPLLGEGHVGQFRVVAIWDIGLWLAILASVLILVGLYYHRKAYKPFYEAYVRGELA
ncbi:cytochrome C [Rhodothermus marinus]|uniref:cytochrome C n=1 Tax=Rhodothermus marinus TaxID=29549 RepID=UPI0037C92BD7